MYIMIIGSCKFQVSKNLESTLLKSNTLVIKYIIVIKILNLQPLAFLFAACTTELSPSKISLLI